MFIKGVGEVAEKAFNAAVKKVNKLRKKRNKIEKESIVTAKNDPAVIAELKKTYTPKGLTSSPGRSTAAAQDALGKRSVTGQSEKGYRGEIKNIAVESKIPTASKTSKKKRLLNANISKLKAQKKYLESLKNKKNIDEADKLKSNAIKRDFGNLSQINNRIKELEKKTYPSQSQIKKQLEYYKSGGPLDYKKKGEIKKRRGFKETKKLKIDQRPTKRKQPIDPRDIFIEGPRTTGGNKGGRGMGKALRGGGKVMRG